MISHKPYTPPYILRRARELRRNMTPEERHLWYDYLRNCGWRFTGQYPIGTYIVDFYCASAKLVIEIDGAQHYDEEGRAYDARRTRFLESCGLTVIRILNRDIHTHFENWCDFLDEYLQTHAAHQAKRPRRTQW